jgi:hypothetical protein
MRYRFLNFMLFTLTHCIYVRKDVGISGYFSKPKRGPRENKMGKLCSSALKLIIPPVEEWIEILNLEIGVNIFYGL